MSMRSLRRFSWGSAARVAYPRWNSVALIEVTCAIVIIGVAAAFQLGAAEPLLAKVRMVNALEQMRVGRIASAEHYAITGKALDTDVFGDERLAKTESTPEYEKHLSASAAFSVVASASGQAPTGPGFHELRDTSAYYSRAGVVVGGGVALGRVRGVERPYRMSHSPAVLPGGGPLMVWTCGTSGMPPGYAIVGARVPDDISPNLLAFPCRSRSRW